MLKKIMLCLWISLLPAALAASPALKLQMDTPASPAQIIDGKRFFPVARAATRPAGAAARQPVMQAKVGDYQHIYTHAPETSAPPEPSTPPDALQASAFHDIFDAE